MAQFINPFTDVGFKRIFGQEINKDLLIDFLNALLEGEKRVKDIRFLDKELLPAYRRDRGVIYDVYCTDESGEQFIVEMQNREQANFRERALYYLSRTVAAQGERGVSWQFDLKAVYGVFFMNFRLAGAIAIPLGLYLTVYAFWHKASYMKKLMCWVCALLEAAVMAVYFADFGHYA